MDDNEHFQEIKEKEIIRLTTPMSFPKIRNFSLRVAPKDCEGNLVPIIRGLNGNRFALEPKPGILTDDEILMYAPESKKASRIRLKRGIGSQSDKLTVNDNLFFVYVFLAFFMFMFGIIALISENLIAMILFFLIIIVSVGVYVYIMHIKDYTDSIYKSIPKEENMAGEKLSETQNLFLLFESKEKIAREMIENKFPAPQLTNSKFNAILDNCRSVAESEIEIINALTPTERTKPEINSRKKLIKQLISKIDDLTNELILSEENGLEEVIDEMDNLIGTVKEYK